MTLKVIVENLDEVPDALREFYAEVDGKFVLQVGEDVRQHPEVLALKSALDRQKADNQRLKTENTELKSKTEGVPEDFSAEEYERLKAEDAARQDDPDNKDLNKRVEAATTALKSQHERALAAKDKKYDTDIAERDTRIQAMETRERSRVVDDGLTKALIDAGVTKAPLLKAAKALLQSDVEVAEEEGQFVARMRAEVGGNEIPQFVQNWVNTEDGKVFVEQPSGAGAKGNNGTRPGEANPWAKATWSKTEQSRLLTADRSKAERLARSAGFKDLNAALVASQPVAA